MPISNIWQVPPIADEVYRLQPTEVLDLGIGCGLYGAVVRQTLDGMHGRCRPDQWKARITGVEAFEGYENPCWGCYNHIVIEDFTVSPADGWDLVLMIDSLEHLEPAAGAAFLDTLVAQNKHVIISVPVVPMPQGAMYGNEFETHRTHYTGTEFERFNPVTLYRGMTQVFSIKGKL